MAPSVMIASQCHADRGRFDIEDAIAEARFRPRMPVMDLIGMQNEDLAGHAAFRPAAIPEGLHAGDRVTDRIGVMPVRLESGTREESFDPLDTIAGRRSPDPIRGASAARSFKTLPYIVPDKRRHDLLYREKPILLKAEGTSMDGMLGFVLAALALTGSPGPATLSLAAAGAAFGAARSLGYMIGIVIGLLAVMAIVASGLLGLLSASPRVTGTITFLAAAYFAYLAIRIGLAPPLSDQAAQRRQPRFVAGLLLSLVNPKGYAAMAALFSSFALIRGRPVLDTTVKAAILVGMIVAVDLAWLVAGLALTRCFRIPRLNRAINLAFAALLLASLAFMLPR